MNNICRGTRVLMGLLLALFVLGGCASREETLGDPVALPLNESLLPGLAVHYYSGFYRHIEQVPSDKRILSKGRVGQPIPFLNHQFKKEEELFDSGAAMGVAVLFEGYLKMAEPGTYLFQAMSNDGIRVRIGGQEVVLDPTVHADRLSEVGEFPVETPGYHPLNIKYFQRKGSARLVLYWQPPGAKGFEVVPAAAYGHLPGDGGSL